MNKVEIKLDIDISDSVQVEALNKLFTAIGGRSRRPYETGEAFLARLQTLNTDLAQDTSEDDKKFSEQYEDYKAKAEKHLKKETVQPKKPEAEEVEETEEATKTKNKNSLLEIRALLAKKKQHRVVMKAKIKELGVPNASKLDPSQYGLFIKFLKAL